MVGDKKRREVAENLRYLADYPGVPVRYAEQFRDELSAVVLHDGFTHDYSELFSRLADLIEPFGHECVPGECPINVRHDNDMIDRDALLELADDCDYMRDDGGPIGSYEIYRIARRIREALGVEHG